MNRPSLSMRILFYLKYRFFRLLSTVLRPLELGKHQSLSTSSSFSSVRVLCACVIDFSSDGSYEIAPSIQGCSLIGCVRQHRAMRRLRQCRDNARCGYQAVSVKRSGHFETIDAITTLVQCILNGTSFAFASNASIEAVFWIKAYTISGVLIREKKPPWSHESFFFFFFEANLVFFEPSSQRRSRLSAKMPALTKPSFAHSYKDIEINSHEHRN